MNPNRSTDGDSALRWINIVQRGGTEEWKSLYRACQEVRIARQVAASLAWRDPDLLPSARLWRFLLEDLHQGLQVDLREEPRSPPSGEGKPPKVGFMENRSNVNIERETLNPEL